MDNSYLIIIAIREVIRNGPPKAAPGTGALQILINQFIVRTAFPQFNIHSIIHIVGSRGIPLDGFTGAGSPIRHTIWRGYLNIIRATATAATDLEIVAVISHAGVHMVNPYLIVISIFEIPRYGPPKVAPETATLIATFNLFIVRTAFI